MLKKRERERQQLVEFNAKKREKERRDALRSGKPLPPDDGPDGDGEGGGPRATADDLEDERAQLLTIEASRVHKSLRSTAAVLDARTADKMLHDAA